MLIRELSTIQGREEALSALLIDAVASGASVGFLTPIEPEAINAYWAETELALRQGSRKLFVALDENRIMGAVQLAMCLKANGQHRGEVEKLMVRTDARGRGIGRALMHHLEPVAKRCGLSLLVLDTRQGDVASHLYRALGYVEAGRIPRFALSTDGQLDTTVFFYKWLMESRGTPVGEGGKTDEI